MYPKQKWLTLAKEKHSKKPLKTFVLSGNAASKGIILLKNQQSGSPGALYISSPTENGLPGQIHKKLVFVENIVERSRLHSQEALSAVVY